MDDPQKDRSEELMRYLDKGMTENDRLAFEAELRDNEQLSAEVSNLEIARAAVIVHGTRESVNRIRMEERASRENETPVIKMPAYRRMLRYGIAAAAAVILIFIAVNLSNTSRTDANQLYAEAYTPYELSAQRGSAPGLSPAEQAYSGKDYGAVINLYKGETAHAPKEMLITGIAFLESGKAREAIEMLQGLRDKNIVENKTSYRDEADYYLALAYLKNKNYPAALQLMMKIHADVNNPYSKKFPDSFIAGVKKL